MKWALLAVLIFKASGNLNLTIKLRRHDNIILSRIALLCLTFTVIHIANIMSWGEHALLGWTIAPPGSPLSRGLIFTSSAFLRRILEPSLILLVLSEIFYLKIIQQQKIKKLLTVSATLLCLAIILEAFCLANPIHFNEPFPVIFSFMKWLATGSWCASLILSGMALLSPSNSFKNSNIRTHKVSWIVSLIFTTAIFIGTFNFTNLNNWAPSIKLATHYYVWFPENWKANYGDPDPLKRLKPSLGEYNSDDPLIIDSHLKAMIDKGIETVFLDWWPTERSLRKRAKIFTQHIMSSPNLKFAFHFETLSLSKDKAVLNLDQKNINRLKHYFVKLASDFFEHPNYLSINGKKVINLYTTRHVVGDFRKAMLEVREAVRQKTGHELYLIGDEVYYSVISGASDKDKLLQQEFTPDWERISALDAITLYNPFDPTHKYGDSPEQIQTNFFQQTERLYISYRAIAETAGIPFIPTVIPSYNDRAIRPTEDHQIIERVVSGTSTYEELSKIALNALSASKQKFIVITSWNEWNEGTNIEP